MIGQTTAMNTLIGTITRILKVTRRDIRRYGRDAALEIHCARSNAWIAKHQIMTPGSKEEELEIVVFAAALQFINVLFATGEIDNGG